MPAPAEAADRDTAARYHAVGVAELAEGAEDTAAVAFARALALDPGLGEARLQLDRICRQRADRKGAAQDRQARETFAEGLALYRRGHDDEALAKLAQAAQSPALRGPASLYRAMLALRQGDHPEARRALAIAGTDPAVAEGVDALRPRVARGGRVVLSLGLEGGYDSNAELAPETPPVGSTLAPRGDGRYTLSGGASGRPLGDLDLVIQQNLLYRDQLEVDSLDLLASSTSIAARGPRSWWLVPLALGGLDYLALGGESYLVAPRFALEGAARLGQTFQLAPGYHVRHRGYQVARARPFDGVVHGGGLAVRADAGWLRAQVSYDGALEGAAEPLFHATVHGPAIELAIGRGVLRLLVQASLRRRVFGGIDPNVGFARKDWELTADGRLELEVSDRVDCHVGSGLLRNASSVVDFEFTRITAQLGCGASFGFF
jgi:hypothetical protein